MLCLLATVTVIPLGYQQSPFEIFKAFPAVWGRTPKVITVVFTWDPTACPLLPSWGRCSHELTPYVSTWHILVLQQGFHLFWRLFAFQYLSGLGECQSWEELCAVRVMDSCAKGTVLFKVFLWSIPFKRHWLPPSFWQAVAIFCFFTRWVLECLGLRCSGNDWRMYAYRGERCTVEWLAFFPSHSMFLLDNNYDKL